MSKPDFSGIDPLRLPEARRRIAAIEEYLKLSSPTTADTVRHAALIDLSRWQFLRLVRVWREHRSAHLLVVGRRGKATRQYSVDPRATEIMTQVIDETEGVADLAHAAAVIEERCAAEGIAPPARATIYNNIREVRARSGGHIGGPMRIVIGRMWFHLPVEGQPAIAMPTLLLAVVLPERHIVAYRISIDQLSPPSVRGLIKDLAAQRQVGASRRKLFIEPDDRRVALDALDEAGLNIPSHYRSVQREISRAFGGKLGPLKAIYRRALARPTTKKVLHRQDRPLTTSEAIATIEQAIAISNQASGPVQPFDIEAN